jgi:phosphoglycolate phosphatase-like HAD superfamily hydrolase
VTDARPLAIDLDVLGDTRPLWDDWLEAVSSVLAVDPADVPLDRGEASAVLDRGEARNWRSLLERYAEERAPAYLRRDASVSAALRRLATDGRRVGVFSDAPEPLARIALAQLGAERRVSALETGAGALERLLARLGGEALTIESREELCAAADER